MKFYYVAAPLLLLAGCASNPTAAPTTKAEAVSCEREYRVGTLLPTKDCKAPISAEERQRLQDELGNKVRPNNPTPSGKG